MSLYARRTKDDLANEREMLLRRGFRFEEPLSLTIFESETNIVVGHACGVLYFSKVLSQTTWESISVIKSLATDDLTQMVFGREYFAIPNRWPKNRDILVLHEPVYCADEVDVEDILAQVWHFVDEYYAVKLDAAYQRQTTMGEARLCNKLVMQYIGGQECDDGLLRYDYNRAMFLSDTFSIEDC